MIKLAIIEDDDFIREGTVDFFSKRPDFKILTAVSSADRFLKYFNDYQDVDIIIIDIGLPGINGLELAKRLNKRKENFEMVLFTVQKDSNTIFQALSVGIKHYIIKGSPLEKVSDQLKQIDQGVGSILSPAIAYKILQYFAPNSKNENFEKLTNKELQVVNYLVDGLSYKEIGVKMGVTIHAIRFHIRNIYTKLEVNSRNEVVKLYHNKEGQKGY